jgi:hypothetical protein
MSNYELLKQKIQEAIPSLKEFINGCIIETPHWNTFGQKFEDDIFDEYYIFNGKVYSDDNEILCKVSEIELDFNLSKCKFGKEPMLNDVLEWLKILSQKMYGETDLRLYNHFIIHFLGTWDLSSPYLKDQNISMSDRLIILYDGVS